MTKNEFIEQLSYNNFVIINSIDQIDNIIPQIILGNNINMIFNKSYLKDYFFDAIYEYYPEYIFVNSDINYNFIDNLNVKNNLIIYNIKKNISNIFLQIIKQYNGIIIC